MLSTIKKFFSDNDGGDSLPQTESSSIQGRKPSQEDSFLITEPMHGMRLVFVADGVGGHGHGDFASKTVVDHFRDAFANLTVDTDPKSFLYETVMQSARKVLNKSLEDMSYMNCGTTISGFIICGSDYFTINIGDSRVYLWSEDCLSRETHDQSIVQQLLDRGEITEEEAFHHPQRNIMTSAIGQSLDMMQVDISQKRTLKHGDILFAFSDGVHDALTDNQIFSLIARYKDTPNLAERLTEAAYNAGGKDNITAVVYRYID
ncbi:MAG: protein phosphatase 2C domain-containing protein [Bacteroidales bacterium]|nr:protein phosphatase 2C domain-containing protein [Bacteroidales bacterium]